MLPQALSYCLFMLTCFGDRQSGGSLLFTSCPRYCECYDAPADGISGTTATSIICTRPLELLGTLFFKPTLINTMVIRQDHFQSPNYYKLLYNLKSYPVISLILEDFTPTTSKKNYIFQIFDSKTLEYLSLLKSKLHISTDESSRFSWTGEDSTSVELFHNLKAINIDSCQLEVLDSSFGSLNLPKLHTLIIRSSGLSFIHRDALKAGKHNLKRLLLPNNSLKNLLWLTSIKAPFSHLEALDLSSNRLNFLPAELIQTVPNLRILNLANNRFQSFQLTALQPFFSIDELSLTGEISNPSVVTQTVLHFTKEHKWIQNLEQYQIEAKCLLNSLVEEFQYILPGLENAQPLDWRQFKQTQIPPYEFDPNRIYFNAKHRVTHGKNIPNSPTIIISGHDLVLGSSLELLNFRLDSATNSEEFINNRNLLLNHLNFLTAQQNSIRVPVFGKRMLAYFKGETQLGVDQIQLIIDQVVDFLDEALDRQKMVILVLWKYSDILETVRNFGKKPIHEQFKENVIQPFITRVSSHPALLGIEMVHQFLFNQFTADQNLFAYPNHLCDTDPVVKSIASPQLAFIEFIGQAVSDANLGLTNLGMGIDASCTLCLPLVLIETCLPKFKSKFTFVTVTSNLANKDTDAYSYVNYQQEPPFNDIAVFYVLQGTDSQQMTEAITGLMEYSAGYYQLP